MSRKPNIDPPTRLHLRLPETLRTRLDLVLFSELEGRVPLGRYQDFFIERIQEYFSSKRLGLEPFGFAPGYYVSGPKEMIEALEKHLIKESS